MAKRRKANRDEVMMIPFLDILCALIGVLILIIVVLCVAQTRQSNGRTPEEESLARKFAELTQMLKTAEQESAPLKTRLAELTATQAEARAREARLTELRKHLEMSGAEAKTNKEQATVLQKQVENQVSQIEAIIRQVTPMAKEIEALKKELELRKKKPDDKPLPVLVQPSGSGFGGNRKLFFVETSNAAITVRKGRTEKQNVGQDSVMSDGNYNQFLNQVKATPNAMLIFLVRADGWASYNAAAGWAENHYGLVTGKLPIPGAGEVDLRLFEK